MRLSRFFTQEWPRLARTQTDRVSSTLNLTLHPLQDLALTVLQLPAHSNVALNNSIQISKVHLGPQQSALAWRPPRRPLPEQLALVLMVTAARFLGSRKRSITWQQLALVGFFQPQLLDFNLIKTSTAHEFKMGPEWVVTNLRIPGRSSCVSSVSVWNG